MKDEKIENISVSSEDAELEERLKEIDELYDLSNSEPVTPMCQQIKEEQYAKLNVAVKQLDTKLTYRNPLHVITQTTKYQEEKLMKQSHLLSHKNNKIPRHEPT